MAGTAVNTLLADLGIRLEDAEEKKFTELMKIVALENAQIQTIHLLHPAYFTELENVTGAKALTDYALAFSALHTDNVPLDGSDGIVAVRDDDTASPNDWHNRISISGLKKLENTYLADGTTNKLYYTFDEKIYVLNGGSTTEDIYVYYLKHPTAIAAGSNCDLNSALDDIILNFAEAELWDVDNETERAGAAVDSGIRQVKILNDLYVTPEGIGTKAANR